MVVNKKRAFTLFFWFMGLNDPYIASDRVLTRYSYLRKLKNGKDWVLIDCGSHRGKFAESARKHLRLTKIIFIDINKEFNSEIKRKFPKSIIINRAITEKRKAVYMVININNPGQNYASSNIKTKNKLISITLTQIFNLYVKKSNVHYFLKMDIEGGEINVLRTLSQKNLNKISVISIEILPSNTTLNFIASLNEFMPINYEFYRERRYGLIHIDRNDPHWTDNLNLFQNLIMINSKPSSPLLTNLI
jgi:FkbM family methyltransferase